MNAQISVVAQIIRDLALREARWRENASLEGDLGTVYDYLRDSGFRSYDESEIDAYFAANPLDGELHEWRGFAFMTPPSFPLVVPVLTMEYRTSVPSKLGLRLALFLLDTGTGEVVSIGYRFESPDPGGENPFYHLQHIQELGNGDFRIPTPRWIPESSPAVPVEAHTEVGLILCLLASLYGRNSEALAQVWAAPYRNEVESQLRTETWSAGLVR